jgi:hypothetical protein
VICALLIHLGAAAGALAATSTGTIGMPWPSAGAEQNLGVRSIPVGRRGGSSGAASVVCTTVNGSAVAGRDFTAVNHVISWASGDGADKNCGVTISNVTPFTGMRAFYVRLSKATGAKLGTSQTLVVIYGDKDSGLVLLSASAYTATQKAGSVTITVDRTNGASGPASVSYATANGSAVAGSNYTSVGGTISWKNGDSSPKTFAIPLSTKAFSGSKTIAVALAGAEGANLGSTKSAIVTITGSAAAPSATGSAALSWTAPTQNTDGTPVTDLTGYNIYYGKSPSALTSVISVSGPSSHTYNIGNLASGTWYFGVRAYNGQAEESSMSTVVSKGI